MKLFVVGSGLVFLLLGVALLVAHPKVNLIGTATVIFLIGGFNTFYGYYAARVIKPAGAVWIRIEDDALTLRFKDKTEARVNWNALRHPIEVRWTEPPPADSAHRYGQVRLFWRPRTRLPVPTAQRLVEAAKERGLKVRSFAGTDSRHRSVLRNVISHRP
ncbi:MAG: hypothetical protein L3K11_06290 [Thermoplasmata archaeon]|nr:hypothetical protein [Thermoplasmata archaeon]